MSRFLIAILLVALAMPAFAQTSAKPEHVARLTEFIAKSQGPYRQVADGIWETSYQGKNMPRVLIRIATAGDGVFFLVSLFPRATLTIDENLLLKIAEFNANYDYVKLALDSNALDLRVDVYAKLLDLETFGLLENQTALAADAAYGLIKGTTPLGP